MERVNVCDALVSVHVEVLFLIHTSLLLSLSNFPLAADSYCPERTSVCASSQNVRLRAKYSLHFEFRNGIVTLKFGCLEPWQ